MINLTFTGHALGTLDPQHRIYVPLTFRHGADKKLCFVISRAHQKFFGFYQKSGKAVNEEAVKELLELHNLDPNNHESRTLLTTQIFPREIDGKNRITLGPKIREALNIKKDKAYFLGEGALFSICAPEVAEPILNKSPFRIEP